MTALAYIFFLGLLLLYFFAFLPLLSLLLLPSLLLMFCRVKFHSGLFLRAVCFILSWFD